MVLTDATILRCASCIKVAEDCGRNFSYVSEIFKNRFYLQFCLPIWIDRGLREIFYNRQSLWLTVSGTSGRENELTHPSILHR